MLPHKAGLCITQGSLFFPIYKQSEQDELLLVETELKVSHPVGLTATCLASAEEACRLVFLETAPANISLCLMFIHTTFRPLDKHKNLQEAERHHTC